MLNIVGIDGMDVRVEDCFPDLAECRRYLDMNLIFFPCLISALQLGVDTVPVLIGPVTYLLLSKGDKSAPKGFNTLSLLDAILPVYK